MNSPENAALRAELTFLRDRLEKIERGSPPTDVRAERSMSLTAIFLEDRLKALALAIVAIVFVGFVLVYLQSVLKLVTLAALLAILLQPLVDVDLSQLKSAARGPKLVTSDVCDRPQLLFIWVDAWDADSWFAQGKRHASGASRSLR